METPCGLEMLFGGKDNTGSGVLRTSKGGKKVRAQAVVSPEIMLSKIAQGFDEEKAGLYKGDAKPLIYAICIGYLQRIRSVCEDERKKAELQTQINQLTIAGGRVELVETYFKSAFSTLGARGVAELAKLIETVERKSRALTVKERDFIKALEKAAVEARGVPYQKDVLKEWFILDAEGIDNTFHTLKKRLGFAWLPAGKRGKKGVQK